MLIKFAIQEFIQDREYRNLSTETLESYRITLNELQQHLATQSVLNIHDVKSTNIKDYLIYCKSTLGNNPTTVNSKLRRTKTFFNYLIEEEMLNAKDSPVKKVSYAIEEIKIEVFNDEHIKQMLNFFRRANKRKREFFTYRGYVMIIVLLGTGVRLGELRNLTWNDVNLTSGTITVFGKKREQSSIPITASLVEELKQYKQYCEQHFGQLGKHVFVSSNSNTQLNIESMKDLFKKLRYAMDFKDVRLSAHTFRHTFAHRMIMNGCDVFTLQKMLRHKELSITQRYLSLWGTALREQNNKYNPLNSIKL